MNVTLAQLCEAAAKLRATRARAARTGNRPDIVCAGAARLAYDKLLTAYAYKMNVDRGTAMMMHETAAQAEEAGECCGS